MPLRMLPIVLACAAPFVASDDRPYPLMVGDAAPPLSVSKWFPADGASKVRRPYVVEFWSAWCLPCIADVPRITALQKKYENRVTFIGAGVWESERGEAEQFVKEQGERIGYLIALDDCPTPPPDNSNLRLWTYDHGKMSLAWLRASGKQGIPAAFIIDAQGRLAWLGEPDQMEEPLAQIVAGTWDLAAHTDKHRQRMTAQAKSRLILDRLAASRREKNLKQSLADVEDLLALSPEIAALHAGDKFEILLLDANDAPAAYAYARQVIRTIAPNEKASLNKIADVIINKCEPARRDLDIALEASLQAEKATTRNLRVLKLLAEVYAARAEFTKAADAQRRALAVAYDFEKPVFQAQLDAYEKKAR